MGNIVGEDHLPWVKTQIKDRQQILGKINKSNEDILWANNKGGWSRLISSINISNENVLRFNPETDETFIVSNSGSEFRNQFLDLENYGGPMLSQELILQGGILNYNEPRFGVSNTTSNLPSSDFNYGYGGTEFGLNAMPGLLGFTSKTYDNGSLRKADIKIKANNKKQFEYLETVYLRLGYTILLEWGNSTFPLQETNDEGTTTTRYATTGDLASLSLKDEFLYSYNLGQNYFNTRIEELRKESQGNYDGFLGMVDNFSWEFQKDGSYLITLSLVTVGSVIQSLKGNINLDSINYPNPINPDASSTPEEVRPTALEVAVDILSQYETIESSTDLSFLPSIGLPSAPIFDADIELETIPIKKGLNEEESKSLGLEEGVLSNGGSVIACNAAFGTDAFSVQSYLRFGTFLEFINKKLLLYDTELNPTHISIDTSIDTYCYSNGWSFPSDPEKMIISYSKKIGKRELNIFATPKTQIDTFHTTITDQSSRKINVGKVMNLYFNKEYIKSLIKQYTDDEKGLSIYKLIETLLNTANSQLGNVNKLKLRVTNKQFNETVFSAEGEAEYRGFDGTGEGNVAGTDNIALSNSQFQEATFTTKIEVKQVLEIYDEVAFIESPTEETFKVYGFSPSSGSVEQEGNFVLDVDLKTNIDKNLTTQIAIGAQAGGRAVGYDSMVFSKWNTGLVDRVIPSKLDVDKARRGIIEERNDWKKLQTTYREYLFKLEGAKIGELKTETVENGILRFFTPSASQKFTGYIIPRIFLSGNKDKEPTFSRFSQIQSSFFNKVLSWDAERKNTITPFQGFLPINLSLTIDGLSGIKIFDKLTVDSRFLPKNYTDTLKFIITELDHSFQNNKWITKLGTQSIPKLFPDTDPLSQPLIPINDIIEEEVEDVRDKEDRTIENQEGNPSYFAIKDEVYRGIKDGVPVKINSSRRIEKNNISELLKLLNSSPVVQNRFRNFFTQILDTYPTGYAFTINDALRPLGDNTSTVGMGSAHQYGLAIDMGIREAAPKGQEVKPSSAKKLYESERTLANVKAIRAFGLPKIAYENDITWGGDYTSGYKYDVVHFAVAPQWTKFSPKISANIYKRLSNLKSKILQRPNNSKVKYKLNLVSIKDFIDLSVDENNNPTYITFVDRVEFGKFSKFGDSVENLKKFFGYNEP